MFTKFQRSPQYPLRTNLGELKYCPVVSVHCVSLCLCEEWYVKYNRVTVIAILCLMAMFILRLRCLMSNCDSKQLHNVCQNNCNVSQCFRIIYMLYIISKYYLISSYVLPSLMAGIWMLRRLRRSKTSCVKQMSKKRYA